jgi:hypothetical protein
MDKPVQTIASQVPQKKGFALIITLSVLAVIIALTSVLIGYLDIVRRDASYTKALIQGNLYYADIQKRFKKLKGKHQVLYSKSTALNTPDQRFSLRLHCRPLANGININWLGEGNNQRMVVQYNTAEDIFENIVQNYSLEDATMLKDMLLEEIGGKKKFVQKEQSRLRQKNGIMSYKQFENILSKYQFEADDLKVGKIPWKKFFVFNKIEKESSKNVMDGNYLSVDLISMLFNLDLSTVKEDWKEGETRLKTFVSNLGGEYTPALFAQKFLPQSQCEVSYGYAGERFKFKFVDIQGEVKNFEFYGK